MTYPYKWLFTLTNNAQAGYTFIFHYGGMLQEVDSYYGKIAWNLIVIVLLTTKLCAQLLSGLLYRFYKKKFPKFSKSFHCVYCSIIFKMIKVCLWNIISTYFENSESTIAFFSNWRSYMYVKVQTWCLGDFAIELNFIW